MTRGKIYGKLREARHRACLNQQELAQKIGTSVSFISRLENDPFIRIDPEMIRRLAEALEVTEEEVWEEPSETIAPYCEGLSVGEREFLGAYLRLNHRSRPRLIQILKEIDRIEAKKRGKKRG